MHAVLEFFCELDELGAWILSKTLLVVWRWIFPPEKVPPKKLTDVP